MNVCNRTSHYPMKHTLLGVRVGKVCSIALTLMFGLALSACYFDDSSSDSGSHSGNSEKAGLSGLAQKGPFQPGGSASAEALVADGSTGGAPVTTTIGSNGAFELPAIDWSGPTQLVLSGAYFSEITGNFTGSVELHGVATLPDEANSNVNIFTHFVAARTLTLMAAGTAFGEARDQARDELAMIVGINAAPNSLNLRKATGSSEHQDDSANLLLFSASLLAANIDQAGIDAMATDFASNGQINSGGQTAFDAIKQAAEDNPDLLATAGTNLQNQYGIAPPNDTDGAIPAWAPGGPTIPAAPMAAMTISGPLEVDGTQSFDAGDSTGNTLSYGWEFGDGGTATGAQASHVYTAPGTYTATLTVTDEDNRSDTDSRDLTITDADTPPDPPRARITIDDNQIGGNRGFLEQPMTFDGTDSRGANLTYLWDFGDGITANVAVVEHTYTTVGDYNPVLTVEDRAGQKNHRSALVTIGTQRLLLSGQKVTGDGALEEKVTDTEDFFGTAGDIDADIAVVGAPKGNVTNPDDHPDGFTYSRGSAFVYARENGTWIRQNKLTAGDENEQIDAYFGGAVAVSGNTIIVGAPRHDDRTGDENIYRQGAVYVFSSSGSDSGAPLKITGGGGANNYFGQALASDAGTVMIGSRGAVHVHTPSSSWGQLNKLTANDEETGFGASIAIESDIAVIGAPDGPFVGSGPGAAYVFTRVNDSWSQTAKLTPSDGESGDNFGASVAISNGTIMVGSTNTAVTRSNGATRSDQGAVYVFNRSGSVWSEQTKLTAADGKRFDNFGASIAMTNDAAVIGTRRSGVGAGYVFTRANGSWSEQINFTNADDVSDFGYGYPVVISGEHSLVGAYSGGGDELAGSAFFYNTNDLFQ